MNERPTPETDALDRELHSPRVLQDRYSEMRDHARRLERERDEWYYKAHANAAFTLEARAERDEARRERDEALAAIVGWENKWKCAVEMAAQAEVERDEAWACCDELVVDSNAITLAKTVMRLERERDEARGERDTLRDAVNALHDYVHGKRNDGKDISEILNGVMKI